MEALIVFAAALLPAGMVVGILMGVKSANGEETPVDWIFNKLYDLTSRLRNKN